MPLLGRPEPVERARIKQRHTATPVPTQLAPSCPLTVALRFLRQQRAPKMNPLQIAAAAAAAAVANASGAEPAEIAAAAKEAATAVAAGAPGDEAVTQALAAARTLSAAQLVREEFSLSIAKAKAVLNPPLVIMLMLYPSVIAFTLAVRYTKYNLLVPTPNLSTTAPPTSELDTSSRNQWLTSSEEALWFSGLSFSAVLLVHVFLVIYITLKGPPQSPRMSTKFRWFAPVASWFCTCVYFFVFTILARYGMAWQEWVLFGAFTAGLFIATVVIVCVTVPLADVVVTALADQA